ncbi:hypothetical protein V6N11_078804 [Hibiscus sabdariffa]|uniref:Stomatal closure-related actin-binding protein Ig domain-containing protein n=1 Tax=Hibiscus sabdariffa TaxID=183260 RepID=A0ABR2RTK1_9ROSI
MYAPEPLDVGRVLQAEILSNGKKVSVTTANPIDSGSHFPDQWTKSSITLDSRIQYWKDEDQALQRMDHKVQRKLFHINAGDAGRTR